MTLTGREADHPLLGRDTRSLLICSALTLEQATLITFPAATSSLKVSSASVGELRDRGGAGSKDRCSPFPAA